MKKYDSENRWTEIQIPILRSEVEAWEIQINTQFS